MTHPSQTSPIRALVIDDEAHARARIVELLRLHDELTLIGEAGTIEHARALCLRETPGVLFLDIEMGQRNGFSLLEELSEPRPHIIFVTAYETFGVQAFAVEALDYLLKPVSRERFAQSVRKLLVAQPLRRTELMIPCGDDLLRVPPEEITHIEAEGNYTLLHREGTQPLLVRRGIQQWEALLPPEQFLRVHRSLIVNRARVQTFKSKDRETGELHLNGQPQPLPLRRRALQRLRRLFIGG